MWPLLPVTFRPLVICNLQTFKLLSPLKVRTVFQAHYLLNIEPPERALSDGLGLPSLSLDELLLTDKLLLGGRGLVLENAIIKHVSLGKLVASMLIIIRLGRHVLGCSLLYYLQ